MPAAALEGKPGKTTAAKTTPKTAKSAAPATVQPSEPVAVEREPTLAAAPAAPVDRQAMIAEAAYYRALARGFAPGQEVDDWLEAERTLDALQASAG